MSRITIELQEDTSAPYKFKVLGERSNAANTYEPPSNSRLKKDEIIQLEKGTFPLPQIMGKNMRHEYSLINGQTITAEVVGYVSACYPDKINKYGKCKLDIIVDNLSGGSAVRRATQRKTISTPVKANETYKCRDGKVRTLYKKGSDMYVKIKSDKTGKMVYRKVK